VLCDEGRVGESKLKYYFRQNGLDTPPLPEPTEESEVNLMSLFAVGICYVCIIYHSCSLAATPSPPSQLQVHVGLLHVCDQLGGEELVARQSIMQLEAQPCTQIITCITLM